MGQKKRDRTGESKVMQNGLRATIIKYNNNEDIDVEFENGVVRKNLSYVAFTRGNIGLVDRRPKTIIEQRLNTANRMKDGRVATIIQYKNSDDIDVLFDDGTLVEHQSYSKFQSGMILSSQQKYDRLGESRVMNCGMKATIISYRTSTDLDVKFDDGAIRTNRTYSAFTSGQIGHPTKKTPKKKKGSTALSKPKANPMPNASKRKLLIDERLNSVQIMNCGMKATVIAYRSSSDIDIQFEDGEIKERQPWSAFVRGGIAHPSKSPKIDNKGRLGEASIMQNGMQATIVVYRKASDVDVEFEDGVRVEHVGYDKFKKGKIQHPNVKYKVGISLQEFAIYYYLRNYGFKKNKTR